MNGFNTLCWGKSHVLANVGSLSGGGGIIPSLSLYVFHHGAVAVQNEDVTEIVWEEHAADMLCCVRNWK